MVQFRIYTGYTIFLQQFSVEHLAMHKHSHQGTHIIEPKLVSEYDQEIPQSQTADNPMTPRGRAAQPSRDTRKSVSVLGRALINYMDIIAVSHSMGTDAFNL